MPRPQTSRSDEVSSTVFWRWIWDSVRPVIGYVLVGLGMLIVGIGWYKVAGETTVAKQMPYLMSCGVFGIALVIAGGRFLLLSDLHNDSGRLDRLETMVTELHAVLLSRVPEPPHETAAASASRTRPSRGASAAETTAVVPRALSTSAGTARRA